MGKLSITGLICSVLGLGAVNASAAEITRTFDVVASDFTAPITRMPGPVAVFAASYTLTFDPAVDVSPTTSGLHVNSITLDDASEYAYSAETGSLAIGTDVFSAFEINDPPGSYGLFIDSPASVRPYLLGASYTTASGDFYSSGTQSLTPIPTSAAPEAGAWMLMLAGVGLAGAALRETRRSAVPDDA